MRKDLGVLQAVCPMPVLMVAAYDENGKVNVMNCAWGQISAMDKIMLFIDESHKTTKNLRQAKAFTVSLADRAHMKEADFFGIASGNDMEDKFERSGLHAVKSEKVNAPVITEFPVCMECELDEAASAGCIVGTIVNVNADEKVIDGSGKIDPAKVDALAFDQFQNGYYALGEKVGEAWAAGMELMGEEK